MAFSYLCLSNAVVASEDKRDKVKAVFLYKFFEYVSWEAGYGPDDRPPATICIFGNVPFKKTLDYLSETQQEKFKNKITQVSNVAESSNCHILYIHNKEKFTSEQRVPDHVLTVSDMDSFSTKGGMIELRDKPEKLELVINLSLVKKAKLKINSGLLKIAEVIR